MTDETLGSHIYSILSSFVHVKDCYFYGAISKFGGAVYIEGNSSIDIYKTTFQNNLARRKGGAIFANGFNRLRVSSNSKFVNNYALEEADEIYVANTEGFF